MSPTRDSLQIYEHTESEGLKHLFYSNEYQKKAGVATHISDKIDFKTKTVIRDKDRHFMIKGLIQSEDITVINI